MDNPDKKRQLAELARKVKTLTDEQLATLFAAMQRQSPQLTEEMKIVATELNRRMDKKYGV